MSGVNLMFMAESERGIGHGAIDFHAHGFLYFKFGHEVDERRAHDRKRVRRK